MPKISPELPRILEDGDDLFRHGDSAKDPAFRSFASGREFEMLFGYMRAGEILAKSLALGFPDDEW
jgi:hypothetical protein